MFRPPIVVDFREVFFEGYYTESQNNLIFKYEMISFKYIMLSILYILTQILNFYLNGYVCKFNFLTFYVIYSSKNTSLKMVTTGGRNM